MSAPRQILFDPSGLLGSGQKLVFPQSVAELVSPGMELDGSAEY